jgi:hypothetical protein
MCFSYLCVCVCVCISFGRVCLCECAPSLHVPVRMHTYERTSHSRSSIPPPIAAIPPPISTSAVPPIHLKKLKPPPNLSIPPLAFPPPAISPRGIPHPLSSPSTAVPSPLHSSGEYNSAHSSPGVSPRALSARSSPTPAGSPMTLPKSARLLSTSTPTGSPVPGRASPGLK